ncbi:MAG: DUF4396 domain-containing protein [Planctomycetes bacterium]|nr:DUF4396 domain-containing protein [Planctomycetota bacterium]MCP4839121.1 DUF4396 domain-containing protein [Planctomycetota bacterium]
MLDGVMLLWFIMAGASVLFVAIDVWRTPEANALRWGFIILTVFAGPLAAIFYILSCREPLPETHKQYVAPIWKQALGSTMHCASGDGLGIITGAAIASIMTLPFSLDITLEYVLGFGFGWLFFQAFAMKDMAGGNYLKSLKITFIPEFFSMNLLMAGMLLVSKPWMAEVAGATNAFNPSFWFIMSMALIVGFIFAYPMNWWLVTRHLKHGMMTVRLASSNKREEHDMASMNQGDRHSGHGGADMAPKKVQRADHEAGRTPSSGAILMVGSISVAILGTVVVIMANMFSQMG